MGCSQPIMLIFVRQKVLLHLMSEYTMTKRSKTSARIRVLAVEDRMQGLSWHIIMM